ncbi:MAG: phosphotransferase [Oscillospiraceae bacterium]|jgi:serine/threonine-protein kinase|nr:phosphotransferase [Oscillospiraceae bacterium]
MNPTDIPGYERFAKVEPITKGMAGDAKYYIEAMDGRKRLLRVADASEYARRKAEYDTMRQAWALGVPMPEPLDFGYCNDGQSVYTLIEWIDGKEAIALLPALPETEQYLLGKQSGEALRLIHQIPAPTGLPDWAERYFGVMDDRFAAYRKEGVPFAGNDSILAYLDSHRELLKARPQCHLHGDFHTGNMIVTDEGKLHIIDWHFVDFDSAGDPWSELTCVETAYPAFSSGQISGYFGGEPPEAFWPLFAYYVAASALASIVWAKYFAPDELQSRMELNECVLRWFDGMKDPVARWYGKDF